MKILNVVCSQAGCTKTNRGTRLIVFNILFYNKKKFDYIHLTCKYCMRFIYN